MLIFSYFVLGMTIVSTIIMLIVYFMGLIATRSPMLIVPILVNVVILYFAYENIIDIGRCRDRLKDE